MTEIENRLIRDALDNYVMRATTPDSVRLAQLEARLQEAGELIRVMVQKQTWIQWSPYYEAFICSRCSNRVYGANKCNHEPNCPVARAQAWLADQEDVT